MSSYRCVSQCFVAFLPLPHFGIITAHRTFTGHFTYECKDSRPYVSRPSRTAQLDNPRLLAKLKADGKPSVEVPEEFKNKSVVFFFMVLVVRYATEVCVYECLTGTHPLLDRSGTADRILEAKEKQRENERTDRAKKRTKRYCLSIFRLIHLSQSPFVRPPHLFPSGTHTLSAVFHSFMLTNVRARASSASVSSASDPESESGSESSDSDSASESSSSGADSYSSRSRSRERDEKRRRPRGRSVSRESSRSRDRSRSPDR